MPAKNVAKASKEGCLGVVDGKTPKTKSLSPPIN